MHETKKELRSFSKRKLKQEMDEKENKTTK